VPDAKHVQYRIVERFAPDREGEAGRVAAALLANPASVAPKYFYDELGCALYGAICRLPEYYPTRTEAAIFRDYRNEISTAIGSGKQFVDLGAGDCCKGQSWMPFASPVRYMAVDIAAAELARALSRLAPDFPEIEMLGVVCDFTVGLPIGDLLEGDRGVTFFYPGSSIGNFAPEEAVRFLARVREHCHGRPGSGLLIGVDGKKSRSVLDPAYDDALGVTAAFNRNALLHLNKRFGYDFALDGFRHVGFYNESQGRVEMHLESLRDQVVHLGEQQRRFARGERIHTENSYKYHAREFQAVLAEAGFQRISHWASPGDGFFVFFAECG
jgi:dimethylhistidine N-methyltransferase